MFFSLLLEWRANSALQVFSSHLLSILHGIFLLLLCISNQPLYLFFPIQPLSVDICTKILPNSHHTFSTPLYIILLLFSFLSRYIKKKNVYLATSISSSSTHTSLNSFMAPQHIERTSLPFTKVLPFHTLQVLIFFLTLWLCPWHTEVPGPVIEIQLQLRSMPQLWQCQIFLTHCASPRTNPSPQ